MRLVVQFKSISAHGPCALGVVMDDGSYDTDFRNVQSVYFVASAHSPKDRFDWIMRSDDILSAGASLFFCMDGNVMEYTGVCNEASKEVSAELHSTGVIQPCFICGVIPVGVAMNGVMDLP